jgi:RpiB/LacA/LacB family sugar-phosphate isomerase
LPDLTSLDLGTDSAASVDYPDFASKLADAIGASEAGRGILICGTGIGISIAANRHAPIRCALVHDVTGARLCRQQKDANVLAMGGRGDRRSGGERMRRSVLIRSSMADTINSASINEGPVSTQVRVR